MLYYLDEFKCFYLSIFNSMKKESLTFPTTVRFILHTHLPFSLCIYLLFPLLQVLILELVSQVRRGSRLCWPATTPLLSSASFSGSCWFMAAGPTCACAVSSAISSTRILLSPWCTSGSVSSVASLLRSENRGQGGNKTLRRTRSWKLLIHHLHCLYFSYRRCMISTSSLSTTLSSRPSLCWPWGSLTK